MGKIPKDKIQKQTDLGQFSYEMVNLIKKFHHISVKELSTIDNLTPTQFSEICKLFYQAVIFKLLCHRQNIIPYDI